MAFRPLSCALLAAVVSATGLTACHDRWRHRDHAARLADHTPLRVVQRLTCPPQEGSLHLLTTAADGRSCTYSGANDAQVSLRLVQLDGETAENALAPIEAELRAQLPARRGAVAASADATPDAAGADQVNINLPGINIDADNDGANIRIGGLHVNADQDRARVSVDPSAAAGDEDDDNSPLVRRLSARGDVVIDANENGAEVRVTAPGRGVRMTYILASSEAGPTGDHLVAYEARGPASGPLVVATLRSPGDHRSGPLSAMKRLVRQNVGG